MKVEAVLPVARTRLTPTGDSAQLTQAAALFSQKQADLIVVCDADEKMVGVVSETDMVSHISQCPGDGWTTMAVSSMTWDATSPTCFGQDG